MVARRKKAPEEDVEVAVDDARRFWGRLHPFYRPLLARDLEIKPFPWREWFFAAAPDPFLDELRKLSVDPGDGGAGARDAKAQGTLDPACNEDGVLSRAPARPDPAPTQSGSGPAPGSSSTPGHARGQARLPW